MNQTRLLRLNSTDRAEYIRTQMSNKRINELKAFCRAYGLNSTRGMRKPELIDVLVEGLSAWAEKESNALYV